MEWEEIFKRISSKEMEDAEEDIEWILTALRDPTYLLVKGDNSNQFLLKHSNVYYVEYVKKVLEERGYLLKQASRFSNAVAVISERDAKLKDRLKVELKPKAKTEENLEHKTEMSERIETPEQEDGMEPED